VASVQPLLLVWLGFWGEGWREKGGIPPFLLSSAGKPIDETTVAGPRVPEFHEMGEDLLPLFLLWRIIPVVKILCGHCHLLIPDERLDVR